MMVQAFVLAALVWSGHVRYWHVAVLAAIYGLGRAIDIPARQAYITDLVGPAGSRQRRRAELAGVQRGAHRGAGRRGAPHRPVRRGAGFLPERVSFVAVLGALLITRTPGDPNPAGRLGIREGVWGALVYAARTPPAAFTLALLVVVSVLVLNFNVLVPLVAQRRARRGRARLRPPDVVARRRGGDGGRSGSRCSARVGRRCGSWRRPRPSSARGPRRSPSLGHFGATASLLVVLGCCQILFSTGCNTTLQLDTPDALRGRVMGLYALAFAGMTPIGSLLVGAIAQHWACGRRARWAAAAASSRSPSSSSPAAAPAWRGAPGWSGRRPHRTLCRSAKGYDARHAHDDRGGKLSAAGLARRPRDAVQGRSARASSRDVARAGGLPRAGAGRRDRSSRSARWSARAST